MKWPWTDALTPVDPEKRTPLWHAALKGDLPAVERELKAGRDPNRPDFAGTTPLHIAVLNDHAEIVERLIAAGAAVNSRDTYGNGPLWAACMQGYQGADKAAALRIIKALLRAGADVHQQNKSGVDPTGIAAMNRGMIAVFAEQGVPIEPDPRLPEWEAKAAAMAAQAVPSA